MVLLLLATKGVETLKMMVEITAKFCRKLTLMAIQ
jgi:hypothetical protein